MVKFCSLVVDVERELRLDGFAMTSAFVRGISDSPFRTPERAERGRAVPAAPKVSWTFELQPGKRGPEGTNQPEVVPQHFPSCPEAVCNNRAWLFSRAGREVVTGDAVRV